MLSRYKTSDGRACAVTIKIWRHLDMEIFPSGAVAGDTMRIVSRLSVSAARRSKHLDYVMRKHLRTQQYTRHVKQWYSAPGTRVNHVVISITPRYMWSVKTKYQFQLLTSLFSHRYVYNRLYGRKKYCQHGWR